MSRDLEKRVSELEEELDKIKFYFKRANKKLNALISEHKHNEHPKGDESYESNGSELI